MTVPIENSLAEIPARAQHMYFAPLSIAGTLHHGRMSDR